MRFLVPAGGSALGMYGILTTPAHGGIVEGIRCGLPWAADNEAFTRGFNPERFFPWLKTLEPYRANCLFVTLPDVVGDCLATLDQFEYWRGQFDGWPMAYVAQDGSEMEPFPCGIACVFIGGSTQWKLSSAADSVIGRATASGLHVHIGRVNWGKRYRHFRGVPGSDNFTCDGTRTRYEGREKAIKAWRDYESNPYTIRMII